MDALRIGGISHPMPCGGHGTCGKCAVWVQGNTSQPTATEKELLRAYADMKPPAEGFALRLACYCRLSSDGAIEWPHQQMRIITSGEGTLPSYDGERVDTLGFAADIGTTTIALRLYNLSNGTLLASRASMNQQSSYGADVLSRIEHAYEHGVRVLKDVLIAQIAEMMRAALADAHVCAAQVERIVIVGNTTMLHFLTGLDPHGIGVSPFTPESLFGQTLQANQILTMFPDHTALYVPRCVSAYVGADTTSGLLATGFDTREDDCLFVDVGTNGEIALQRKDRLVCCATAAGPAFEGAQIAMGMPAAEGAICGVSVENGTIAYETIGGGAPAGICGTGMISLLAMLLSNGVLDETGLLCKEGHVFTAFVVSWHEQLAFQIGDSGVFVTAQDIRQIQLSKAAIAAGIDTLLFSEGISQPQVSELLLAGGFGSQLDPMDAARIGLIPKAFAGKTRAVGNAALLGACAMLFSLAHRHAAEMTAQRARELSLSASPVFMDHYIENMMFPER